MRKKEIKLSPRLEKIYREIDFSISPFLDVGSDHGFLPIYLYKKGFQGKIYASEVIKGPYEKLVNSINEYELNGLIEPLFGDGLKVVGKREIKQIAICGMGGNTISSILKESKDILPSIEKFILEPQTDYYLLRMTLVSLNFKIAKEVYIEESKHFYPIIIATHGQEEMNEIELIYGKYPLINKDPLLKKYLISQLEIIDDILSNREDEKLKSRKSTILKALDYF